MHHNINRKLKNIMAFTFNIALDAMVKLTDLAIAVFL